MNKFFMLLIITIILSPSFAIQQPSAKTNNNFLIQLKILVNNRSIQSTNISLSKFQFNLSSIHLKRAVTANLKLFAWYNGYWVERNVISIKLTDKRAIYKEKNHLISKLLKYKNRNLMNQMYLIKEDSILKRGKIFVSYDIQSSLLVSRLQDIQHFNEENMYVPLSALSPFQTKQSAFILLQFLSIVRSDDFIDTKNYISSLNSIQNKIKDMIPLVTAPISEQEIEPYNIYRNIVINIQNLLKNTKKYKQKQAFIKDSKFNHILIPFVDPIIKDANYYQVISYFSNLSIKTNDTLISTYNYVINQLDALDTINALKNTAKKTSFSGKLLSYHINQIGYYDILLSYICGGLWIILDIIFIIKKCTYVSSAFIFYLKRWLFFQILLQSFRIGSLTKYYYGIAFLFLIIILERFITYKFQNQKKSHTYTFLDQILTQYTFNIIILAIITNLILHLLYFQDIKGAQIVFWSFSQAKSLISQYYYAFVMIPSIILTFKYKSTKHISFLRLFLLFLISLKDDYWILLDENRWMILLKLKEQIILTIILLLSLIYGRKQIKMQIKQGQEKLKSE